jgi:galactokinase
MRAETADHFSNILTDLYGNDRSVFSVQFKRYKDLITSFHNVYKSDSVYLFSTPGRTELGGNHTDHNNGLVLAGSVNLDTIATAEPVPEAVVTIFSEGYPKPFILSLKELDPVLHEAGTTSALIRGIAYKFSDLKYIIGGFNAVITSDVAVGSGLSSSASIEMLIGNIFNYLYNDGLIAQNIIARIGQFAENVYFDKPCGLMDQIACASGGIVKIDFKDPLKPDVSPVQYDFDKSGYNLIIVNTGGDHADLTDEYASIPAEMKSVASFYDKTVCRDLNYDEIIQNIGTLRKTVGDRAILRVLHFFRENQRVHNMVQALESDNFDDFLQLSNRSGDSSFKWLQNIFSHKNTSEQEISLALALTEQFIHTEKISGACRIHGGGFAGTIQAVLPADHVNNYKNRMDSVFGRNSAQIISIRKKGSCYLGYYKIKNFID